LNAILQTLGAVYTAKYPQNPFFMPTNKKYISTSLIVSVRKNNKPIKKIRSC